MGYPQASSIYRLGLSMKFTSDKGVAHDYGNPHLGRVSWPGSLKVTCCAWPSAT
jgi:hypothetical protein